MLEKKESPRQNEKYKLKTHYPHYRVNQLLIYETVKNPLGSLSVERSAYFVLREKSNLHEEPSGELHECHYPRRRLVLLSTEAVPVHIDGELEHS